MMVHVDRNAMFLEINIGESENEVDNIHLFNDYQFLSLNRADFMKTYPGLCLSLNMYPKSKNRVFIFGSLFHTQDIR